MLYNQDLKEKLQRWRWDRIWEERFYGRYEYQAYILRSALKGWAFSERVWWKLIVSICTKRLDEIKKIKDAYWDMYGGNLIKDIQMITGGYIRSILLSMVNTNRDTRVDIKLAQTEAKQLYDSLRNEDGTTDESILTNIFSVGHSFEQLGKIFLYYKELRGHSIRKELVNLRSANPRSACLTIIRCIEDPIEYYSEEILNSLGDIENGNNLDRLKYVIVSRCEIDLKSIKERFQKLNGTSMEFYLRKISNCGALVAYVSDKSQIHPPVWQQVKEIMDTLENFLPVLEFGISRIIALFAANWGFQSSFNAEHLTFNNECDRVDGRNLSCDTAVAVANLAVIRDGRPVRISWKIHEKKDEMWIGFTIDQSHVTSNGGYWCSEEIISYYGGRESYIGHVGYYPAIEEPVLGDGKRDSGYGSLQIPGIAKHVLQPYSKGDEIELEVCLTIKGNGDWISLYHNKKPQLTKWSIDSFTQGIVKLFPCAVIDTRLDDVQFALVL